MITTDRNKNVTTIGDGNPETQLDLYFFGSPMIKQGGRALDIGRKKAIALLAYLTLTRQPARRDTLAALLWPDSNLSRARTTLRITLSDLKKALGSPWLDIHRQTVRLNTDAPIWSDVNHFQHSLAICSTHGHRPDAPCVKCIDPLTEAVALYRDDFLAGFTLPDCTPFEDWQAMQTNELRRKVLRALGWLADYRAENTKLDTAISLAQRMLDIDPLDETAHRRLIRWYIHLGRQADALQQYDRCVTLLQEKLDVAPQQETTQMIDDIYQRARQRNTAVAQRCWREESLPPHNLPPQLSPFLGREVELQEIHERFNRPTCRLITILGAGGMGKTQLAIQYGRCQIGQFANGIFFISLATLDSETRLPTAIGNALGFAFSGPEEPRKQLLNYLRSKEMLLILDNFEHLLAGSDLLMEILQTAPDCQLLVTSRESLNMKAEWLYDIGGLHYPANRHQDDLTGYSAVQLFLEHARRVQPGFRFSPDAQTATIHICQLVAGMPLGLELAATMVRELDCTTVARKIEKSLDFLVASMRDMPERHHSLRAVFDLSWQGLSQREQDVFMRVSIFRGGFTLEAANRVAGATITELSKLVDKSFLRQTSAERYALHEVLRQFGVDEISALPEERFRTQSLHSDFYAGVLYEQEPRLKGVYQTDGLREIEKEIDNVRAAWQWACRHKKIASIECGIESLYHFYETRSWFDEGQQAFNMGVDRLDSESEQSPSVRTVFGKVLAREGAFHFYLGHYKKAEELLQESVDILQMLPDQPEFAFTLLYLGKINVVSGDYAKARRFLDESARIAAAGNQSLWQAASLHSIGQTYYYQGAYDRAKRHWEQSLSMYQQLGYGRGKGVVLNDLGRLLILTDNAKDAVNYCRTALGIYQMLDDQLGQCMVLGHIGWAYHVLGEADRAIEFFTRALQIARQIGDRRNEGIWLGHLGEVLRQVNRIDDALHHFQQAYSIFQEIGDKHNEGNAINGIGSIYNYQGHFEQAKIAYYKGLSIMVDQSNRRGEAVGLSNMGLVCIALGQYSQAVTYLQQALGLNQEMGHSVNTAVNKENLATAYRKMGHIEEAVACYQEAIAIYREKEAKSRMSPPLCQLGICLAEQGDWNQAEETLQQALLMSRDQAQYRQEMRIETGFVQLALARGELHEASERTEKVLAFLAAGNSFMGVDDPLAIYLTCYKALSRNNDPRAETVLSDAYKLLQSWADKISDGELRISFLANVAVNQEIVRSATRT